MESVHVMQPILAQIVLAETWVPVKTAVFAIVPRDIVLVHPASLEIFANPQLVPALVMAKDLVQTVSALAIALTQD